MYCIMEIKRRAQNLHQSLPLRFSTRQRRQQLLYVTRANDDDAAAVVVVVEGDLEVHGGMRKNMTAERCQSEGILVSERSVILL